MEITVKADDSTPVYEQLVQQVQTGVISGQLQPEGPLPPIRKLASQLGIHTNTVARAYRILERSRIIKTVGRKGTFIHPEAKMRINIRRNELAKSRFSDLVDELMGNGLEAGSIRNIFDGVIHDKENETGEPNLAAVEVQEAS